MEKTLNSIKEIACWAGAAVLSVYNTEGFSIDQKSDGSPLTKADKVANKIIVTGLRTLDTRYPILAEESTDDLSRLENDHCWLVDPLDGTKEFIKRNGEFTVNIALVKDGKSVLGVVYQPVTEELYYAAKGTGAYWEKGSERRKIAVSERLNDLVVVGSRSHVKPEFKAMVEKNKAKIAKVSNYGSSLKGCKIAKGEADVYYRFGPMMEWDTAAMHCIIEEAGGIIRQLDDSELIYNKKDPRHLNGFSVLNKAKNKMII